MGDERRVRYRPWDDPATPVPLADLEALREAVRDHGEPIEGWERRPAVVVDLPADGPFTINGRPVVESPPDDPTVHGGQPN